MFVINRQIKCNPMALTIDTRKRDGGGHIVALRGRLDSLSYTSLEQALTPFLNGGTRVLILDLQELEYVSSSGLRVIFKTWKNIEAHGGSFSMTHLRPQITAVFEVIKALPSQAVFASIDEANAYLDMIQRKEREKHDSTQP